jgi:hypothetical protein
MISVRGQPWANSLSELISKKTITKKVLVMERLKVKTLSLNLSTTKIKELLIL